MNTSTTGTNIYPPASPVQKLLCRLRLGAALTVTVILGLFQGACSHADIWSELPPDISSFIVQYFPNSQLQSYTHNAGSYHVRIDGGPGLTFGASYNWTDIDGYGMPLPQVLLFDQLPPKIYDYLQETEQLNAVFSISRDATDYTLILLNNSLIYTIATGELSGTDPT